MAQHPNTYTSISGRIIRETEAAMLFQFQGTSYWFPLSQTTEIHREVGETDDERDQIKVADWLLVKKGISL